MDSKTESKLGHLGAQWIAEIIGDVKKRRDDMQKHLALLKNEGHYKQAHVDALALLNAMLSAAAPQVVADERKGSPYPDYDRGFSNGWDACAKRAAAPVQAQEQWIDKLTYDAQVDEWAIEKGNLELEIEALKSRTPVQAQEPIGYAPTYLTERMAAGDSAVMLTVTRKPLPGHGVTVALYTAPVQPADVPDGKYGRLTGDNIAQPVQMKVETK